MTSRQSRCESLAVYRLDLGLFADHGLWHRASEHKPANCHSDRSSPISQRTSCRRIIAISGTFTSGCASGGGCDRLPGSTDEWACGRSDGSGGMRWLQARATADWKSRVERSLSIGPALRFSQWTGGGITSCFAIHSARERPECFHRDVRMYWNNMARDRSRSYRRTITCLARDRRQWPNARVSGSFSYSECDSSTGRFHCTGSRPRGNPGAGAYC